MSNRNRRGADAFCWCELVSMLSEVASVSSLGIRRRLCGEEKREDDGETTSEGNAGSGVISFLSIVNELFDHHHERGIVDRRPQEF